MQIICLGDSITDCNHLFEDFPLGNGYVQILSEMFRNQTPSFSISADTVGRSSSAVQLTDKSTGAIHFRNCGIDGFTVTRVLENIRQHRISLHHSPVVTLLIGINDIGLIMNTDRTASQKEQMMREFAAHYNELLDLLTADSRQVILMEPFIFPHPEEYETWIPYVILESTGGTDRAGVCLAAARHASGLGPVAYDDPVDLSEYDIAYTKEDE